MNLRLKLFYTYLFFSLIFALYLFIFFALNHNISRIEEKENQIDSLQTTWYQMLVSMNSIMVDWDDGESYKEFKLLYRKLQNSIKDFDVLAMPKRSEVDQMKGKIIALKDIWVIAESHLNIIVERIKNSKFETLAKKISRNPGLQNLNKYLFNNDNKSEQELFLLRDVIEPIVFFPIFSETFNRQFNLIKQDITTIKTDVIKLHKTILISIFLCVLLSVSILSYFLSKSISNPIIESTRKLINFIGESIESIKLPKRSEIKNLDYAVNTIIEYYSKLSVSLEEIAEGNISQKLDEYENHDVIAHAIADVLSYLNSFRKASEHIKHGNFNFELKQKSNGDILTQTFNYMKNTIYKELNLMDNMLQSIEEAICVIDANNEILKVNNKFKDLLKNRCRNDSFQIQEYIGFIDAKDGIIQNTFKGIEKTNLRQFVNIQKKKIPFKITTRKLLLDKANKKKTVVMVCLRDESNTLKNKREKEELKLQATIAELKALRAQINPHFLFNSLNSITQLIDINPDKAVNTIALLADLFRYTLMSTNRIYVTVHEEIEYVKKYLEMNKIRFGKRLSLECDIDSSITKNEIPPMLLQPLIENSIKYGEDENGNVKLSIKVVKRDKLIHFLVKDEGRCITDLSNLISEKTTGLYNVNNRINTIYKEQLHFQKNLPTGLIVSFSLPIRKEGV